MPETIELNQDAAELKEQAREKYLDLKRQVAKEVQGELGEDETALTDEEYTERRDEVDELLREAKRLEDMNSLEGLAQRLEEDPDQGSQSAKAILQRAGFEVEQEEETGDPFESSLDFLKAIRSVGDPNFDYELTDAQQAKLNQLAQGAKAVEKGESFTERSLGDEDVKEHMERKAVTGDTGDIGAALVPTVHMSELLRAMAEDQQFVQRARQVPMARREIDFPRLQQDDMSNSRPLYGFAAVSKIGEGEQKDEREPTFEQFTLKAVKYAAYLEAGDELLQESIINTRPLLVELLTDAIAYEYDRDAMRSNSGDIQGFIDANATWNQNRASAGSVGLDDIFGMEERFFGSDGVYLHHPSVIPDIYGLQDSNVIVWNPDLADDVPGTLLGRPLVRSHKLPTVGSKGDLSLCDPSFYLAGNLQNITVETSQHYRFRNDLTAYRAVFRAAGSPWPAGQFSAEASGSTATFRVSPFVTLDAVATS